MRYLYESFIEAKQQQDDYSTEKSEFKLIEQELPQEITSILSTLDFLIQEQNKGILDRIADLDSSQEIKLILDKFRTKLGLSLNTQEMASHSKSFVEQEDQRRFQEEEKSIIFNNSKTSSPKPKTSSLALVVINLKEASAKSYFPSLSSLPFTYQIFL